MDFPFSIIDRIVKDGQFVATGIPWRTVYYIVRPIVISIDITLIIFIWIYIKKALSYRMKVNLRALPPNIADIFKKAGVRESYARRWQELRKEAGNNPPDSYRLAIMNADTLIDALLKEAGFVGNDTAERMGRLNAIRISPHVVNGLFRAHKIRNSIAHDVAYVIDARTAERTLDLYQAFLEETSIIT